MRGLTGIPTRMRTSSWFAVDAELEIDGSKQGGRLMEAEMRLVLVNGERIVLLPRTSEFNTMKLVSLLADCLPGRADGDSSGEPYRRTRKTRVLLRHTRWKDSFENWDILVSPHDELTLALYHPVTRAIGTRGFEEVVDALRAVARPVPWPEWIPNDEAAPPMPGPAVPDHVDQHIWKTLCDALCESVPLEEDQIRYDVTISRLEIDSLDAVSIVMELESALDISISDETALGMFDFETGTLGDAYEALSHELKRQRE